MSAPAPARHAAYVLGLADDAMVYAQRLGEWLTNAPQIEEDMALANISLDLLGQARALYARVGELDGTGRGEDDYAMFRDEREWRNVHLVEQERDDFGREMARLVWFSAYQVQLHEALASSSDDTVAAVAGKAVKEVRYHLDHASQWVRRLGDGTAESHDRMQAALVWVQPYVPELFADDSASVAAAEAGVGVLPSTLSAAVTTRVSRVVSEATLTLPDDATWRARGGREGVHSRPMGYLLAEMQHLARSHPGGDLVTTRLLAAEVEQTLADIPDPEVPVLTIADLGILRSVRVDEAAGEVEVVVTPTYSGCPAMEAISAHIAYACRAAGWEPRVTTRLSPAWTTDWMSEAGREKLQRFGIAPPSGHSAVEGPVSVSLGRRQVACPRCGSTHTSEIAHFGSTACKALRRCEECREPFDEFKTI